MLPGQSLTPRPELGLKLTKAYAYLGDVKDHKRVIPFRRFAGGVGRASQAKEFKATQGASDCALKEDVGYSMNLVSRTLAREIRQIHPCPFEERGIKC